RDRHARAERLSLRLERGAAELATLGHRLHGAAGAETTAGPGEDDHTDLCVIGEPRERLEQRGEHRPGHGVEPVGTIQREHGDSILDDFQQILAHWRDPPEVTVSPPMVPSRRRGGAPWKPSNAKA